MTKAEYLRNIELSCMTKPEVLSKQVEIKKRAAKMKVKIFTEDDIKKLESNINEWLKENSDIEIINSLQSESVSESNKVVGHWSMTITILYK